MVEKKNNLNNPNDFFLEEKNRLKIIWNVESNNVLFRFLVVAGLTCFSGNGGPWTDTFWVDCVR